MTTIFQQFEQQSESWKADHDAAMACRDVEDMIRTGLAFFFAIRVADEAWSKKVQSGDTLFDATRAKQIHQAYQWWIAPCGEVLEAIQKAEQTYAVENAEVFRECTRRARRTLNIDIDSLIESVQQAADGKLEEHDLTAA